MSVADDEVVGDVVQRDVDEVGGDARSLVVGATVQAQLGEPLFALGRRPRRTAGLPIDDLDAVAATVDRVEFADRDVRSAVRQQVVEGDVDLDLDFLRLQIGPLRRLEAGLQLLESAGVGV